MTEEVVTDVLPDPVPDIPPEVVIAPISTFTDSMGRAWARFDGHCVRDDGVLLFIDANMTDDLLLSVVNSAAFDPKVAKWEAIKAYRDALSDAGGYSVEVGGVTKWFHSDLKSKLQQMALFNMGAAVPPVPWKTKDGSFVTMTAAVAASIFQAAAVQDMAIFAAAEAHRAAMEASEDPAAYDFSAEWPATFTGTEA